MALAAAGCAAFATASMPVVAGIALPITLYATWRGVGILGIEGLRGQALVSLARVGNRWFDAVTDARAGMPWTGDDGVVDENKVHFADAMRIESPHGQHAAQLALMARGQGPAGGGRASRRAGVGDRIAAVFRADGGRRG